MNKKNIGFEKITHRIVTSLRKFSVLQPHIDQMLNDKDINELTKWSWLVFVFKILSLPFSLLITLGISRWFGAESMGIYSLVMSTSYILTTAWLLGLWSALPSLLGQNQINQDYTPHALYASSIKISLSWWLVLSIGLFVSSSWIAEMIFTEPRLSIAFQGLAVVLVPLIRLAFNKKFLIATKEIFEWELVDKILVPWVILLWLRLAYRFSLEWLLIPVWSYIASILIWLLCSLIILKHKGYIKNIKVIQEYDLLKRSLPMLVTGLGALIISYTDILMLWWFTDTDQVWIYSVAIWLSSLVLMPGLLMHSILAPILSEQYWSKNIAGVQKLLKFFVRSVTMLSTPIVLVFVIFAKEILGLFGEEFVAWSIIVQLLSIWRFINNLHGANGGYLMLTGRQIKEQHIVLLIWLMNALLNLMFIPRGGLLWAAFASVVTLIVHNILTSAIIFKTDHIKTHLH